MADNLLEKASILLTPTAYNDGSMLSVKPENGDGDFTFSRGSAATRVNAQGLVENVQIISSELVSNGNFSQIGTEEVSNGNFSQGGQDWTISSGASVGEDKLDVDAGAFDFFATQTALTNALNYKVTLDAEVTSGDILLYTGTQFASINSSGSYTFYTTSDSAQIRFRSGGSGFEGSITNISVKEVGQDWTLGTGWSVDQANSKAVHDSSAGATAIQNTSVSVVVGKKYELKYTASNLSGGYIRAEMGGLTPEFNFSDGTYTYNFTATTNANLYITASANVEVTNISVKEITDDTDLPRINYEGFSYQDSLGSEEVVNGDFATNSNWSLGNWTIENNTVTIDGQSGILIQATPPLVAGKKYKWTFEITEYISGSVKLYSGGGGDAATYENSVGTHTQYFVANGTGKFFYSNSFNGSIDNVSVKEYLGQEVVPDSGCGSWLLEPQSTNLYLNSDTLATQSNATSASTYTVSFYGTGTITFSGTHTGTLVGTGANDRVSATFTTTSGTLTSTISGDCTKGQLENLSYATSYIPTNGAIATRLADVATNSGNSTLINSTEGVLYAEIAALADDGTNKYITINNGGTTDYLFFRYRSDNNFQVRLRSANTDKVNQTLTLSDNLDFNKIAFSYKENEFKIFVNGSQIGNTITTGATSVANTLNRVDFSRYDGASNFIGKTKALVVYKEALTDAQLQSLTTI